MNTLPLVGETIHTTLGHAETKAIVDGVFPVTCIHEWSCCWVVESTTLRGNPVVSYVRGIRAEQPLPLDGEEA